MQEYSYTKSDVNVGQLSDEIKASGIATELLHVSQRGDELRVTFAAGLSAGDKTTLDGMVTSHQASAVGEKRFYVEDYNSNGKQLLTKTWYHTDNGDDTYSDIVEQTVYTYNGNKLTEYTTTFYLKDGTAITAETWRWYTNGNKRILKQV